MASLDPRIVPADFTTLDSRMLLKDFTSLALPSEDEMRSGQRRVMDQVNSMRRTKSRHSSNRSGSTSMSPTSPTYDSVFGDGSRFGAANGGAFFGNRFSRALSLERSTSQQVVHNNNRGSTMKKITASNYRYDKSLGAAGQANTSRSEPDLAWQRYKTVSPKRSVPPQRVLSNMSTYRVERSKSQHMNSTQSHPQLQTPVQIQSQLRVQTQPQNQSQVQTQIHSQSQPKSPTQPQPQPQSGFITNGTVLAKSSIKVVTSKSGTADITMKEAVEYLSRDNESYQHCGASYIQHNTFIDDKAKEEVQRLGGIPPLVNLLRSPSVQVHQTASAALRNLTFKSNSNKEAIQRCGGITQAVSLLRETDSVEIQKQLTGLLWNLSSVDSLKPDLLESALPVLMERVILPYTTGPERTNTDPEAFFHATACLRNISSSQQNNRQAMRKCRGLVDSLTGYVKDCVEAGRTDDKSVENSVCILHNLTFKLEDEAPGLFSKITALSKNFKKAQAAGDTGPIGCFSPQSKSPEQERHFDFPVVEDPHPNGAGWLIHSQTLQSYLSLLATSQREETREACCGAMQNLTAGDGIVSAVMSQTIVQKLKGLKVITPLLKSKKVNLQRNAVALVGNLTKNPNLHNSLARKALPELASIVSAGTKEGNESDDTLAMACQTANVLFNKDPESTMHLLNPVLITSLNELSQNGYFSKSKKAAALLLYNLWSEKDLQSFLKKG
ncbi:LOW QUALITY PROTEIN: plakophilin-1-like [Xyrichtys novacula]|uniref:LOW QUALITY PROTEIN: plakophilin-1-like n=1 Tax=Xyrichtys novacula TaxID=13765 RepID=A0AAV1ENC5_XYRNO|nr:LOW QUALITY PROTEIN: plakophilin-1-like [Xyrichtys novacula]